MLSCRIDLAGAGPAAWSWRNGRLVSGPSWIQPIDHPAVTTTWTPCADGGRLVVAERNHADGSAAPGPGPTGDRIGLDLRPGRVLLTAGIGGTAPVLLTVRHGVLHGSWSMVELAEHLDLQRLVDRVVIRLLTRQLRYSCDTAFACLYRLTERATATATAAGLTIAYPAAAEHVLAPRALRAGIDPVAVFDRLLAQTVARVVPADGSAVGIELSGGLDSATVAVTLARRTNRVTSFGLLLDDLDPASGQTRRRRALTAHLGLPDVPIPAARHPPFALDSVRGRGLAHDPNTAFYREAFDAVTDAAQSAGIKVMVTGLGGDELLAVPPRRQPTAVDSAVAVPWLGPRAKAALPELNANLAPISVLPLPTLMALALHNPSYLAAGIWPAAPLTDPGLIRFAEQLPLPWRRGKALLRCRLRRAGLPRMVTNPARPESFSPLMQRGLRHHGLPILHRMLTDSILIDTGFIDPHALAVAYDSATTAPRLPSRLCDTIATELALRSLTGNPLPTKGLRQAP